MSEEYDDQEGFSGYFKGKHDLAGRPSYHFRFGSAAWRGAVERENQTNPVDYAKTNEGFAFLFFVGIIGYPVFLSVITLWNILGSFKLYEAFKFVGCFFLVIAWGYWYFLFCKLKSKITVSVITSLYMALTFASATLYLHFTYDWVIVIGVFFLIAGYFIGEKLHAPLARYNEDPTQTFKNNSRFTFRFAQAFFFYGMSIVIFLSTTCSYLSIVKQYQNPIIEFADSIREIYDEKMATEGTYYKSLSIEEFDSRLEKSLHIRAQALKISQENFEPEIQFVKKWVDICTQSNKSLKSSYCNALMLDVTNETKSLKNKSRHLLLTIHDFQQDEPMKVVLIFGLTDKEKSDYQFKNDLGSVDRVTSKRFKKYGIIETQIQR